MCCMRQNMCPFPQLFSWNTPTSQFSRLPVSPFEVKRISWLMRLLLSSLSKCTLGSAQPVKPYQ